MSRSRRLTRRLLSDTPRHRQSVHITICGHLFYDSDFESLCQCGCHRTLTKDPYNFDFLTLASDAHEREVEAALVDHIQKFLIEMGSGFAFVGRQFLLEVAGEDCRLDLLFYHLKLRCFVVIELKSGPFKPEYTGKMNFYLAAVDDTLKHPADNPSIELILCKSKRKLVVEYALRNTATPMGIAEFRHLERLPAELEGSLPSIEEIEQELAESRGKKSPSAE